MRSARLALFPLALLSVLGCSAADEPPPFGEATTFQGRLATDLGCPVYVDTQGGRTFVAAQGATRVLAPVSESSVGETVRDWARGYASDFGVAPEAIVVAGEARGPGGLLHVVLSTGVPEKLTSSGYGLDITLDQEGRLLGATSRTIANLKMVPTISEAKAAEIALNAMPRANDEATDAPEDTNDPPPIPSVQLELTTATGEETPRLAFEVRLANHVAWVDAHTGDVLATTSSLSNLQGESNSWRYYTALTYPDSQKTRRIDYEQRASGGLALSRADEAATFWSAPKSRIVVHEMTGMKVWPNGTGDITYKPIVSNTVRAFDLNPVGYATALNPTMTNEGLGVDAMAEVTRVDEFFQRNLLASPARRLRVVNGVTKFVDEPVNVVVHANHDSVTSLKDTKHYGNLVDNAAFERGTTTVYFGDGMATILPQADQNRSLLLSTDAVGHEMTHMWLDTSQLGGEAAGLEEALGDVVGQLVEHAVAEPLGERTRPDRLAESSFVRTKGLRNLAQPEVGEANRSKDDAHQAHYWSERTCLLHDAKGKALLDSRGQPRLDPNAYRDNFAKCKYESATVIGHAFYLMTFGGQNATSHIVVRNPIGWTASQALWLSMIVKAPIGGTFRAMVPPTVLDLAERQLAAARVFSADAANAVGCAWEAVGVLRAGTTQAVVGTACTEAAPIDCSRRRDGVYCDERQPFAAVRCKNGSIAGAPAPCATGRVCRPDGGFIGNTAEMLDQTTLACHLPSD